MSVVEEMGEGDARGSKRDRDRDKIRERQKKVERGGRKFGEGSDGGGAQKVGRGELPVVSLIVRPGVRVLVGTGRYWIR